MNEEIDELLKKIQDLEKIALKEKRDRVFQSLNMAEVHLEDAKHYYELSPL